MYNAEIVERRIGEVFNKKDLRLKRYTPERVREAVAHLDSLMIVEKDKWSGRLKRSLTEEEVAFIRNEIWMCKCDFSYFFERYPRIQLDDGKGGIGVPTLLASQRILLSYMGDWEREMWDQRAKIIKESGRDAVRLARFDAICAFIHKARQLGFCLGKGTKVLTADLRWINIEDVQVGDRLVSADEAPGDGQGKARKLRVAIVEALTEMYAPTLKVTLEDGRTFVATPHHKFICRRRGGTSTYWEQVGKLKVGDKIRSISLPWADGDKEDYWFAGLLDGEGSLRGRSIGGCELSVSQVEGAVLDRARKYLTDKGY